MLKLLSLVLCIAALATAGKVDPVQECGEFSGTFLELRVEECEGSPCVVTVGIEYLTEVDFIPRDDSPGLTIKLSMILPGVELVVLETPIEGSGVSGGEGYTFRYPLAAAGILVGGTFDLELQLSDTESRAIIVCLRAQVMVIE